MKTCTKCQKVKSLDQFYKRSDRDAYHSWCKSCKHLASKSWHRRNKERHNELTKRWYAENTDKHLENSRSWYQANKARKLETVTAREKRCILATPTWADRELIKELYELARKLTEQTGIPHEVDHVIPLQGKEVCGLHIAENMQVITAKENRQKSNKLITAGSGNGQSQAKGDKQWH
jgi:hypothetical protein